MPDYQEGKTYKIHNAINGDIFIGSTTLTLCEIMGDHRSGSCHQRQHLPIYNAFRELGFRNSYIELIGKCPCHKKANILEIFNRH